TARGIAPRSGRRGDEEERSGGRGGRLRGGARRGTARGRAGGGRAGRSLRGRGGAARPIGGGAPAHRGGARGRRVRRVEARSLEDDAHRVEDLPQGLLRALGAGGQRVLAEALVLLETMSAVLAGVDVRGHAGPPGCSMCGPRTGGREEVYDRAALRRDRS